MKCQESKELLMGYLDGELTDQQKQTLEQHLSQCTDCKQELEDFRRLIAVTSDVTLKEPEQKLWDAYWSGLYNRLERGIGWILFSVAAIALLIWGGFQVIEAIIVDPAIGVMLKIGLLALLGGLSILFVSVVRERLFFHKKDRYKDVIR